MTKVVFRKPDITEFKKKGYFCIDMHVHTEFSPDSSTKVSDILKRAKELGIGIGIADHNMIEGAVKASRTKGVLVIPGIEACTKEGMDILFYFSSVNELKKFYKKIVEPNKKNKFGDSRLSALEILNAAKKYKCFSSIAHPYKTSPRKILHFSLRRKKVKEILENADAVEAINGGYLKVNNRRAARLARRTGKPATGGSDSHKIRDVGKVLTCVKAKNAKSALDKIKKGNSIVIGR